MIEFFYKMIEKKYKPNLLKKKLSTLATFLKVPFCMNGLQGGVDVRSSIRNVSRSEICLES